MSTPELPAVGTRITLVAQVGLLDYRVVTHCGWVERVFPEGQRYDTPGFRGVWFSAEKEFSLRDEGVTWIRGLHSPGSKEAQALLAAALLADAA